MDNSVSDDMMFLGLILRAGFLEIGDESVGAVVKRGKARAVFSALDASERSKRRAKSYALTSNVEYSQLPWTKENLGGMLGRGSPGILAVTDAGMAENLLKRLRFSAQKRSV